MGFFSWKTQDTNRSIANNESNRPTFTVYMVNPETGEYWREDDYEGYGEFGGKDFYELVAELNGKEDRGDGIDIALLGNKDYISPILVEDLSKWKQFVGQKPKECRFQGYFYPADEKEDAEVERSELEDTLKSLKSVIEIRTQNLADVEDSITKLKSDKSNKKLDTEALEVLLANYQETAEALREKVAELDARIAEVTKDLEELQEDCMIYTDQLLEKMLKQMTRIADNLEKLNANLQGVTNKDLQEKPNKQKKQYNGN